MDASYSYNSDLYSAALEAMKRGVLTPLIKQELKNTIQSRRVAEGKEELTVEFNDPESFPLSREEQKKVVRRREQNRKAARRFRTRQRQTVSSLRQKIADVETKYVHLQDEYQQLKQDRDHLQEKFYNHLLLCNQP